MKSRLLPLIALLLVGAMSACTDSGGRHQPVTPSAKAGLGDRVTPSAPPSTPPSTPPSAAVNVRKVSGLVFRTPSANIGCDLSTLYVRCDIGRRDWTAPPKPADCELDWGNGVYVDPKIGAARFLCASDSLLGATTETLAYGQAVRAGDFQCDSESVALRCANQVTGHGFTLSIQQYLLF